MGLFATLNPEQLGRVQRARAGLRARSTIGACLDAVGRRPASGDFWNIVLVHLVFLDAAQPASW